MNQQSPDPKLLRFLLEEDGMPVSAGGPPLRELSRRGDFPVTNRLPELLDGLAKCPHLFVHPVTFATVKSYLYGLAHGLRLAGIEITWDDYLAAAEARGWDPRGNIGIERDFTRNGLSDEEMVRELIAVESNAYARALARINMPT
jgi:hypothetical protein